MGLHPVVPELAGFEALRVLFVLYVSNPILRVMDGGCWADEIFTSPFGER